MNEIQNLLNQLEIIESNIQKASIIACKLASDYEEKWEEACDRLDDAIIDLQAALEQTQAAKNELYDYNNQTWLTEEHQ